MLVLEYQALLTLFLEEVLDGAWVWDAAWAWVWAEAWVEVSDGEADMFTPTPVCIEATTPT